MHRLLMLLAVALQHAIAFAPPPLRTVPTRAASSLQRLRTEPSSSSSDKAALTVDDSALGVNASIQERLDLFRRLAVPYFQQAEGAKLQFGLLLVLVLCQSGVSVIFSFVGRDFYSALSAKDLAVFQEKTANYAVGLAVATPLTVLYKFQRQRLALSWRQWMTGELAKQYYQDRAYYRVELDRDIVPLGLAGGLSSTACSIACPAARWRRVATIVVLLGTLFPLVMDAFSLGKYSVGPPYFNAVFVPLMALVMPFMTVGPLSRWREDSAKRWLHELLMPGVGVLVVALVLASLGRDGFNIWIALAVLLAGWVALGVFKDLWRRIASAPDGELKWRRLTPSFMGMTLAHLGFAAVVLGAVVVTQGNQERDLRMAVGDVEELGGYRFELLRLGQQAGPNYLAEQAVFEVTRDGQIIAGLVPEKRRYFASGQIMTEAAIDASLWRDLYIALGEPIGEDAWAVRLQYKPMVRWLWLGSLMIGLGALVTALDRRYRSQAVRKPVPTSGVAGLAG